MKKLALAIAAVFLLTGIAAATDFSLTGSYYVRGTHKDNLDGTGVDVESYGDYDMELSLNWTWQIDDTTKVFMRTEIADETWGTGNINEGTVGLTDTTDPADGIPDVLGSQDDNIYIEQVWAAHTFGNGGTLTVGKMSAGAWGTAFHDQGDEAYRIKWVQPTAIGTVIGIIQKQDNGEQSTTVTGDDEDDDAYILAMVTKIADINVKPLFAYARHDSETAAAKVDMLRGMLALDGAFGNIGWEAEFDVFDFDADGTAADYTNWGAYLNVWTTIDAVKFGALVAYGSEDNGVGFDFGDDFEAGGAMLMGDDITFPNGGPASDDLSAGRLIAVYFDWALTESLSWGAYAGYATCGIDDNSAWDDADVYEISTDLTYQITPNVTYKVAVGTAQLEYGDNTPDPDRAFEAYHRIDFSF
jgi:hypothetical protein